MSLVVDAWGGDDSVAVGEIDGVDDVAGVGASAGGAMTVGASVGGAMTVGASVGGAMTVGASAGGAVRVGASVGGAMTVGASVDDNVDAFRSAPQLSQKRSPGNTGSPHSGHTSFGDGGGVMRVACSEAGIDDGGIASKSAPQMLQKRSPGKMAVPHDGHDVARAVG
jgi:hypothetical protein